MRSVFGDIGWFVFLTGVYAFAALFTALAVGKPEFFVVPRYLVAWPFHLVVAAALVAPIIGVVGLSVDRDRPVSAGLDRLGLRRAHLVVALAVSLAAFSFYGAFTSFKTMLPLFAPFHADVWLADLDDMIHGGQPYAALDPWFPLWLDWTIFYAYSKVWSVLVVLAPTLVAVLPAFADVRKRFFVTFAACWIGLGNVAALAFMSAGPVFYGAVTGDHDRFDIPSNPIADYLWHAYETQTGFIGTGISAMPSLHLAMATLYLMLALRLGRVATVVAATYLALIMVGSVRFGWHYAVDGYVSIAFVAGVWWIIGRARRPRYEPSTSSSVGAASPPSA